MCRYCIMFVSAEYAEKVWTNLERQNAQARAFKEKQEYILPARFDDTKIPGLLDTVGYIDLNRITPSQLSELVAGKLGKTQRQRYLPPTLDRLYARLEIEDNGELQHEARSHAWAFFEALCRMTREERDAVIGLLWHGCQSDLPHNVHIDTDLLRRCTGMSMTRLKHLLGKVQSLGFQCSVKRGPSHEARVPGMVLGEADFFYLTWTNLNSEAPEFPELEVACEMIGGATENYCEEHGKPFLERLDFSQLSTATASEESDESED